MTSEFPSFDGFFEALWQRPALPWQSRLAGQLRFDRSWPSLVGLPTGLGKTACIDIAVWAMAADAAAAPDQRWHPTRIWYVVNRRLLVDAAYNRAAAIARRLAEPGVSESLAAVAEALRSRRPVGDGSTPLQLARFRGGAELDPRPRDPCQPAFISATVAMFASRWLFSGYGTSRSMRPVDAALAGTDSLLLLDEAHLAVPLVGMADPLAACDAAPGEPPLLGRRGRPQWCSLTATGTPAADAFMLDAHDLGHPIVRRRVSAAKPARVVDAPKAGRLAAALADEAVGLLGAQRGRSCLVFANRPATARQVFELVAAREGYDVVLLTGQIRPSDAAGVVRRLLDPGTGIPSGERPPTDRPPLVVVATQTLEVGADVSADYLVSELTGRRALIQRLGRVNRLGEQPWAAVRLVPGDVRSPLYGDEPGEVADLLGSVEVDLGPAKATELLGGGADGQARPPELLPSLVWEWVKTTNPPFDRAPVERYFDPDDRVATAGICWRTSLPPPGCLLDPPVAADETVELPLGVAVSALSQLASEGVAVHRLDTDRAALVQVPFRQRGNEGWLDLRPGDTVVLPATAGCYDRYGWAPDHRGPVADLSLERASMVVLDADALAAGCAGEVRSEVAAFVGSARRAAEEVLADGGDLDALSDAVTTLVEALVERLGDLDGAEVPDWLLELLGRAATAGRIAPWPRTAPGGEPPLVLGLALARVEMGDTEPEAATAIDIMDDLSFLGPAAAAPAELASHLLLVGTLAGEYATSLGLPAHVVDAVRLAGQWHDCGKEDPRFQQWLRGAREEATLLAKSTYDPRLRERHRVAAGWPRGGRHEVLSARAAAQRLATGGPASSTDLAVDADLVVHLIAAHHGGGRPACTSVDGAVGPPVLVTCGHAPPVTVDGDLSSHDRSQPARFRRLCERYGYWGLALLEAIVRQADHTASALVQPGGSTASTPEVV